MKAAWFALFAVYWWYFNANVWAAGYRSEVVDSIQIKIVWRWFDAWPSRKLSFLSKHKHTHTHTHTLKTDKTLPWPNGYESLWPRSHSCCSRPQSEDLQAAGETHTTWIMSHPKPLWDERGSSTLFMDLRRKRKRKKKKTDTQNGQREALDVLMWDGCVRHEHSRCSDTLRRRYRRFSTYTGELITYWKQGQIY